MNHAKVIAQELSLEPGQVERTLELFLGGATLPFVARYRKEVTGNLDEVMLGKILERGEYFTELDARKKTVIGESTRWRCLVWGMSGRKTRSARVWVHQRALTCGLPSAKKKAAR